MTTVRQWRTIPSVTRLRIRKPPHLRKFSFDRLRQAVRLYTGGKSFTEVGMEMGVSKARAQQLYHEAVKLWKERNLEQSPEEPPDCPICGKAWPEAVPKEGEDVVTTCENTSVTVQHLDTTISGPDK